MGGRSKPSTPVMNAEWKLRQGRTPNPPLSLPYRAIARSCPKCGDLMTTPDHLLRRSAGDVPRCRPCAVKIAHVTVRRRLARDPEFARQYRDRIIALAYRRQMESVEAAYNNGKEWTGPELQIVDNKDLTARQVAAMLGRTIAAVKLQRAKLKVDPRTISRAS